MSWEGHLWTVAPYLAGRVEPPDETSEAWETTVEDPDRGPIPLRGRLCRAGRGEVVVVLVHGLGGGFDSGYMRRAATAIERRGFATLRLGLRGSDRSGADFYHAGLTADLHAAVASPALRSFSRVFLVGFSLGGHMTLRYACEAGDARVQGVAAVCPPLDLAACQRHIDVARRWLYRTYLLSGLKEMYVEAARRGPVPTPLDRARRVRTLWDWDHLTVVPRFGFGSVDRYYETQSAGPRLADTRCATLVVAAEHDPMVPADSLRPYLGPVTARIVRSGGHVGFPRDLHLGFGETPGLVPQLLSWLGV